MNMRFVALAALVLCVASVVAVRPATAQTPAPTSTPIVLPTVPPSATINPYAKEAIDIITGVINHQIANNANASNGQVTYFKRFEMQVQTGRNSYRSIHLHQGTVINPIGKSLEIGQQIQVSGRSQGDGSLNADTITINQ